MGLSISRNVSLGIWPSVLPMNIKYATWPAEFELIRGLAGTSRLPICRDRSGQPPHFGGGSATFLRIGVLRPLETLSWAENPAVHFPPPSDQGGAIPFTRA